MTKRTILFALVAGVLILWLAIVKNERSQSGGNFSNPTQIGNKAETKSVYSVEDVRIDKAYSNSWGVRGLIRNNGTTDIKGHVKVKFLNSRGDVIHTYLASVNDNDPLRSGQAGNFKYFTNPSDFDGIVDFQVILVER